MLSYLYVVATYALLFISTPFIISTTTCFGTNLSSILSRIAYQLNLHYSLKQVEEPVILCVGIVTFYIYVMLSFFVDVVQAYRRHTGSARTFGGSGARLDRFERANRELRELFPSFIVSSVLLYANTTRFDTLRNSFILLQTMVLLLQPLATMCPRANPGLLCKYFYRSTLCWSLLYAILPRETNYFISSFTRFFYNTLFLPSSSPPASFYTDNRYNIQQWIL